MKSNIVEKFNQLPPGLHEEVKVSKRKKKLKLDWAGGLKEFRDQYTALELQKEAVDWWERSTLDHPDQKPKEPVKGLK